MENKFLKELKSIVSYNKHSFLLAVSGGVDSIVLFHLFQKYSIKFSVAHCNFSLRGDESNDDELFVKDLCKKNNIDCYVKKFNTKKEARDNKISIQMAARELRYQWLEEKRDAINANFILVGHHSNDDIETFLETQSDHFLKTKGLYGIAVCP